MRRWLAPPPEADDEGFRQEVLSLSHAGLDVLGMVEIAIGLVLLVVHPAWQLSVAMLTLGAAAIATSRIPWSYPHSRILAAASAGLGAALQSFSMAVYGADDFSLGGLTVLWLSLAAAIPLRPLYSLGLGAAVTAFYAAACQLLRTPDPHPVFIGILALLATALSAVLYAQRHRNYQSYLETLRASQDLRVAQSRLQLTENASTMGRLSAALSHELSSPVGALSCAVDSLLRLSAKQALLPASEQPRLAAMQEELRASIQGSTARLKVIANRMQRFNNLDEAETQTANLSELLQEAAAIVERDIPQGSRLDLQLAALPEMTCRPQQLIAVFCGLLNNSIQAVDANGHIAISAERRNEKVEIAIRDNGRGISSKTLAHIFDPGFQVSDGRVSTGNWSLFRSRQIIQEHGGEIRIRSAEGEGTTVSVTLPCR